MGILLYFGVIFANRRRGVEICHARQTRQSEEDDSSLGRGTYLAKLAKDRNNYNVLTKY